MIYWRGINIGDWQIFKQFANIKITKFYSDTPIIKGHTYKTRYSHYRYYICFKKQGKEQEELLDQLNSSKETPIPLPSMVITKSPI